MKIIINKGKNRVGIGLIMALILCHGCSIITDIKDPAAYQYIGSGSGVIGTLGGEVYVSDTASTIHNCVYAIPAGALALPLTFTISQAEAGITVSGFPGALIIKIIPENPGLSKPAIVGMSFKKLNADETDWMRLYSLNLVTGVLTELDEPDFDMSKKVMYGKTYSSGYFVIIQLPRPSISTGTFTDIRDNNLYKWLKIGDQTWMAENLNFNTPAGSYCYNNLNNHCDTYGKLYDWSAASMACPSGWHLPTDGEWMVLESTLGMSQATVSVLDWRSSHDVGHKLKSTTGWSNNGNGSNMSTFDALPAGFRDADGSYQYLGEEARFWTVSTRTAGEPWMRLLQSGQRGIYRNSRPISRAFSVRCVKN